MKRTTLDEAKRASVGQLLIKCGRLLDEIGVDFMRQHWGMNVRRAHTALFPHIDLEGTRLTELARRLGVSKQAVGPLVDELVAMNVLVKAPDPTDRRARLIRFAEEGEVLLRGLQLLGLIESQLRSELGPARWFALQDSLQALEPLLESWSGGGGDASSE